MNDKGRTKKSKLFLEQAFTTNRPETNCEKL